MNEKMKYHIAVQPEAFYLTEHSHPDKEQYVFAYRIRLTNEGSVSAKLLTRHWVITDENGHQEEVRGPGVVGENPQLAPGQTFEYMSGARLKTPVGMMQGSYSMLAEDGTQFEAEIPAFTLAGPRVMH